VRRARWKPICGGASEGECFRALLAQRPHGACDLCCLPAGCDPNGGANTARTEVRKPGQGGAGEVLLVVLPSPAAVGD
jgi:hypothetical protein